MNKHKENKAAWEEAYDYKNAYDKNLLKKVLSKDKPYIHPLLLSYLDDAGLKDKTVGQFCCNNGRELLTLAKHYPIRGIGFDIAKNMVEDANMYAKELQVEAEFFERDIFEIERQFKGSCDILYTTVGVISWFYDLQGFFNKVAEVLKPGGDFFLFDMHPLTHTLALPSESNFDKQAPTKLVNNYFEKKEWKETDGMFYMSTLEESLPFYSYSFTVAELINSMICAGLEIVSMEELAEDVSDVFSHLDSTNFPLTIFIHARLKK